MASNVGQLLNATHSARACLGFRNPMGTGGNRANYRRQDGAGAAARFEKFLPARASLRPPISLKFATE